MRSPLCAESYTVRAIFSSLEPDRAESVLSLKGGMLGPSPFSLLIRRSAWKGNSGDSALGRVVRSSHPAG
jgi:hypothetical protein